MHKIHFVFFLSLLVLNTHAQEVSSEPNSFSAKSLNLRTNIPTWLMGVPSLGVSYKTSDKVEIIVDGAFSPWKYTRNGYTHYWKVSNISPEVRTYVNKDRSTYLGAQFSIGQYNISSQQGKYLGGGLTVGKQYYAGKNLLIDLGLTLGYLRFSDRASYTYHNNAFYTNRVKEDSNYWGPTSLSIKLSRKIN